MRVTLAILVLALAGLTGQTYAASAPVSGTSIQIAPASASAARGEAFQVAPGCPSCRPIDEEEEFSAAPIQTPFQVAPNCTTCGRPIDVDEEEFSAAPIQEPFKVAPGCPGCRPIDEEEDIV